MNNVRGDTVHYDNVTISKREFYTSCKLGIFVTNGVIYRLHQLGNSELSALGGVFLLRFPGTLQKKGVAAMYCYYRPISLLLYAVKYSIVYDNTP